MTERPEGETPDPDPRPGGSSRARKGRRVVFLNRFYWPDISATAQLLTQLAEGLVGWGWEVTVIAGAGLYDGGRVDRPRLEERGGVRVHRVPSSTWGRGSTLGRLADYASYGARATWSLQRGPRPDIVVAGTDPPLLGASVAPVCRRRGVPLVRWMHDVYPELAARLGVLEEGSWLYRRLMDLERRATAASARIVALGDSMAEHLRGRFDGRTEISVIPNWVDCDTVRPIDPASNPFRREHGLEDRFVVLYSGNAGRAHRFEELLDAAETLREDGAIVFLFVGGGPRRPCLEEEARERGLGNVRFMGYQPFQRLAESLSAADVSVVTEAPEVAGLVIPSKTAGVLASGRPVVYVGPGDSETATTLRECGCGECVSTGDAERLVEVIRGFRDDPGRAREMSRRARATAERRFDLADGVLRWAELLSQVVG